MRILGIDTSTDFLNLAIAEENGLLISFEHRCKREHGSRLISLIKELLKKSDLSIEDLDGFAVSIGPGSFTGLRVGVSAVKGLALSSQKPVVSVPTLDVIAANAVYFPGIICPIIDARKNKIYSALYESKNNRLKRISRYLLVSKEELTSKIKKRRVLFLGDGIECYKDAINKALPKAEFAPSSAWFPRGSVVAEMGLEALLKGKQEDPYQLVPMYLYSRECSATGK